MCLATQQLSKQLLAYEKQVSSARDFAFFSASALVKKSVNSVFSGSAQGICFIWFHVKAVVNFPRMFKGVGSFLRILKKKKEPTKQVKKTPQKGTKSELINL